MTEDRLTHLLTEATDLAPSDALRHRVADPRPAPRIPWFALSGATATLAIAAFLAVPRPASAAGTLRRAAQNGRTVSAVIRSYDFSRGAWRFERRVLVAPGWRRYDHADGGFRLDAPEGGYERQGKEGPVVKGQTAPPSQDGPTLDEHLRFLKTLGYPTNVSWGARRQEGGRTYRDIVIDMGTHRERETITLDERTELPIRVLSETRLSTGWVPQARAEIAYPGPPSGAPAFWAGIDRSRIVTAEAISRPWEKRLQPVIERLGLSDGTVLKVRDLRVLPTGDVLMLYTGPQRLRTRLVGEDGTAFVRVPFTPNDGRVIPRNRPPLVLDGEPLRGMWFTPREEGSRASGAVRLEILERRSGEYDPTLEVVAPDPRSKVKISGSGTFRLNPDRELAAIPAWADAIDYGMLKGNFGAERIEARMVARYDRWIDPQGATVEGVYALDPDSGSWAGEGPPAKGLHRDPQAASEAATELRRLMAYLEARGTELNPSLVDSWLGRFTREARGE